MKPSIPTSIGKVADEQLLQMEKEMANAAESIEKQYAAIRPQMERQFRQMSEALAHQSSHTSEAFKRAGLL